MNDAEATRLAGMVHAVRPDWPESSLKTFIVRDLRTWSLLDAAVALAFVACEQNGDGTWTSRTPARVKEQGPWRSIGIGSSAPTPGPPKRDQQCPTHPGSWKHNCAGCRADRLVGVDPNLAPEGTAA